VGKEVRAGLGLGNIGRSDGLPLEVYPQYTDWAVLTALSKSSVGKEVQQQLEAKLPELQAQAQLQRESHEQARARSSWYGAGRPRLPGPLGAAPHLRGATAGDAGFDPLGLATEPAAFDKYQAAELLHARWAMLGVVGCLVPEALALNGVELGEPVWWK
ncbi:Chlorophyll a-b binding protein, chloroplastic, partial [Tetrabaena socialis]